ncbi:MAG TPA: thiolase family protein [Candidatus Dormibacteraeota bacterium]|nr:thiolase family protein [Candidatus Dormibacteraeota bacterium]
MREAWVRGAAMTAFGKQPDRSARELVEEAVACALRDAELEAADVQAAFVGNAAGGILTGQESMRGQTVLRRTGLLGAPIVNVENADASGSTALHLAWQAVAYGIHDCVVAVGYEKFDHQDRARSFRAVNAGMDLSELSDIFGSGAGQEQSVLLQLAGAWSRGDGRDRFETDALVLVAVKNHFHASLNPRAQYRQAVTAEQVLASRRVAGPLTKLMCAPLTDGAACVVVCAGDFPRGRRGGARIAASVLRSGRGDDLRVPMTLRAAAGEAYETAGLGPEDLDVAEVHDVTSIAELFVCGELGFCPRDEGARLVRDRTTWLGGALPVNTSGGLIARGHPHGATGIAQVVELTWQLEGRCGQRQVPDARAALADNVGGWIGGDVGAGVIHILVR